MRTLAGLSASAARERLASDGPNVLPTTRQRSVVLRFAGQLTHFFALMLWAAAGLAFVAGLPALTAAIVAVVIVNGVFSFVQVRRAEAAAARLSTLLPVEVSVRRDGVVVRVDASEIVVDDVVVLDAGDRICADGVVTSSDHLQIDESLLTGESEPVTLAAGHAATGGSFVVTGTGEMTVTATGARTRLAGIAAMTTTGPHPVTPLTRELHRLVRMIAAIAIATGSAFFAVMWMLGRPIDDGAVFAIGVTVALVPEALLPTVTLSLAWGAEQMAHRQVLVRHLDAVETLGSTTFICTDKTGTLTQNHMTVVATWVPDDGDRDRARDGAGDASPELRLALAAVRCSTARAGEQVPAGHPRAGAAVVDGARRPYGDPTEIAVDEHAARLGIDADLAHAEPTVRFGFDAARRRTSAVHGSVVHGSVVSVKGAPDAVLPLCSDTAAVAVVHGIVEELAARGLRVLAVAGRRWDGPVPTAAEQVERDLELYGVLGLEDPPRDGVVEALADVRRAGIRIAMLTGDHPVTARAIAEEVGLLGDDRLVLRGADLPADDRALGELLDLDGVVVARVSPEDKLRIARGLRARGHVVAMTGDGVNDAPALHEADIGIAMGRSGTDVAREAADLVLLDDHLASIVAGVEQGRATFHNIRRFLTYHLTDNVAELAPLLVWALSGGRFPLAIGVLQILALDLGTDTLSAVALGAERPAPHTLDGPPVRGRLLDREVARRAFGLQGPLIATMSLLAFVASLVVSGWRPGEPFPVGRDLAAASGAAFVTIVLGQAANVFACRSDTRTPAELGWFTNPLLAPAKAVELAFALAVVGIAPIAARLDHAVPNWSGWAIAIGTAGLVVTADALDKRRQRRRRRARARSALTEEDPSVVW